MNLRNVRLILFREIRDQLRDRRTMFMIFVLPLLLYPLMGMSLFQVVQFRRPQPSSVLAVDMPRLAGLPPLADSSGFDRRLFPDDSRDAELLKLGFLRHPGGSAADGREAARRAVQSGDCDAAVYFPPEFAARLAAFQKAVLRRDASRPPDVSPSGEGAALPSLPPVPSPEIIYTTANERSQIASGRLHAAMQNWIEELGKSNLRQVGVPAAAVRPFDLEPKDVAKETAYRGAALWSKILPVMLLIWAMTGAFYPAVDLCAGEKERGTLETLLSSPAERSEIVLGKLLTIMVFSIATAALNLLSMGAAGWLIFSRATEFGPPPPLAPLWLSLALLPISALYSALCLALAALARSTREGQYYLVPLLLVTMPLAVLPMAPGVELNLGNSLIPITGVVLLLRSTIEGAYWQALQYLPVVLGVTLTACFLAVRWAVDQFNSETVLFRESERLDIGLWLRRAGARPASDAQRRRGGLLRRAHPLDHLCHPGSCPAGDRRLRRHHADDRGRAIGGHRHAGAAHVAPFDQQSAANPAAASAAMAGDPRRRRPGRGRASGGQPAENGRRQAVSRQPGSAEAAGADGADSRPRPLVATAPRPRAGPGGLRRTGLPRIHPLRAAPHRPSLAGDLPQRRLLRRRPRRPATIVDRLPRGRRHRRVGGADARVSCRASFSTSCTTPWASR